MLFFFNLVRVTLLRKFSRAGDQKNKEHEYSFFFVLVRVIPLRGLSHTGN